MISLLPRLSEAILISAVLFASYAAGIALIVLRYDSIERRATQAQMLIEQQPDDEDDSGIALTNPAGVQALYSGFVDVQIFRYPEYRVHDPWLWMMMAIVLLLAASAGTLASTRLGLQLAPGKLQRTPSEHRKALGMCWHRHLRATPLLTFRVLALVGTLGLLAAISGETQALIYNAYQERVAWAQTQQTGAWVPPGDALRPRFLLWHLVDGSIILAAALALPSVVRAGAARQTFTQDPEAHADWCLECGYAMGAHEERMHGKCPECGSTPHELKGIPRWAGPMGTIALLVLAGTLYSLVPYVLFVL